jgi:hypothetical protein
MNRLREAEAELVKVFRTSATKHEAHTRVRPIMAQLSRDPSFLSAVLVKYLTTPGSLDRRNYPVVTMDIALNPWFGLAANCWIPLPGRETNISTKAIHHHGTLLLTTAAAHGPGYEHWTFTLPKPVSEGSDLYTMDLIEVAPHPQHHVDFVDAWTGHTPFYPKAMSITLALMSSGQPTTWRDRVKRLRVFRGRERQLRKLAIRLGLKKGLEIKVVDSFDFYPVEEGFNVTRERVEFALGPNEDHVRSVFHVVQETGNEALSRTIRRTLDAGTITTGRPIVEKLVGELERGTPIEGRLSPGHYDVPHMNFTREQVLRSLAALKARTDSKRGEPHGDVRKLAAEARGEAPAGARAR